MANEKRLIDVDNAISHYKALANIPWNETVSPVSWKEAFEAFIEYLDEAPTVDAVEVVHGYWIDSYSVDHTGRITEHGIDCSVCDSVFKADRRDVVQHWKEQFKVCPFCGALMDGGNEDGS